MGSVKKVNSILISISNIMCFLSNFKCLPILIKLNISISFQLVDSLKPKLSLFSSSFIINA